jgi:hypothetical protein
MKKNEEEVNRLNDYAKLRKLKPDKFESNLTDYNIFLQRQDILKLFM